MRLDTKSKWVGSIKLPSDGALEMGKKLRTYREYKKFGRSNGTVQVSAAERFGVGSGGNESVIWTINFGSSEFDEARNFFLLMGDDVEVTEESILEFDKLKQVQKGIGIETVKRKSAQVWDACRNCMPTSS